MKLISCYIENFGGLSGYSLDFNDGLTVIQEDNGFGKTTFAEFLRAMFYGFPRAGKTLDKNTRKRYAPWQGGRFGGNLTFEHGGKRYRIERSFGEVPRSDTFALYDADTQRKSTDFSSDIGLELFRLDAESFERSTYMPQLHETGPLTTDSIQAKLSDLVEDTNDINNYDKAIAALRAKRSALQPYRGSGGSIAQAQRNVSALQAELAKDEGVFARLAEGKQQLAATQAELDAGQTALTALRQEMTRASRAKEKRTMDAQYRALLDAQAKLEARRSALEAAYPMGLPTEAEVEAVLPLFDKAIQLSNDDILTPAEAEAMETAQALAPRFAGGIPAEADIAARQAQCGEYTALLAKRQSAALPDPERARLESLETFFASGVPGVEEIDTCREKQKNLTRLTHALDACRLKDEDAAQLRRLRALFPAGAPTEEVLAQQGDDLSRLDALRDESARLSAALAPPEAKKTSPAFLPVLLLGIAGLIAGIVLLTLRAFAPGGICLGLGAAALIGAVYLRLRDMLSAQTGITAAAREALAKNQQETAALEDSLRAFTGTYLPDDRTPAEKLRRIAEDAKALAALEAQARVLADNSRALTAEIEAETLWLRAHLAPYFGEDCDFDRCIDALRMKREQVLDLRRRNAEGEEACRILEAQLGTLEGEIAAFLAPYCGAVTPSRFQSALAQLQRHSDSYTRARKLLADREARLAVREEKLEEYGAAVAAFAGQYGLALSLSDRGGIRRVRDDVRSFTDIAARAADAKRASEAFHHAHREILDTPEMANVRDFDTVNAEENALSARLAVLNRKKLDLLAEIGACQELADTIPARRDELESWQEQKAARQRQCDLLDKTMEFLEEARKTLSDSYLVPLRDSFRGYLSRLTGERRESIFLTSELDVRMERLGEVRELGYFSAGQTDMVMLCMRLALIDALFKDAKPFIILDDPFVNLDDRHTAHALELLRDLSRDHQILYLTCSTGRTPH